jgi:hypothetical protein
MTYEEVVQRSYVDDIQPWRSSGVQLEKMARALEVPLYKLFYDGVHRQKHLLSSNKNLPTMVFRAVQVRILSI